MQLTIWPVFENFEISFNNDYRWLHLRFHLQIIEFTPTLRTYLLRTTCSSLEGRSTQPYPVVCVGGRFAWRSSARRQLVRGGTGPRTRARKHRDGRAGQRGVRRLGLELAGVHHAGDDKDNDREAERREQHVHPNLERAHPRPDAVVTHADAAHTS